MSRDSTAMGLVRMGNWMLPGSVPIFFTSLLLLALPWVCLSRSGAVLLATSASVTGLSRDFSRPPPTSKLPKFTLMPSSPLASSTRPMKSEKLLMASMLFSRAWNWAGGRRRRARSSRRSLATFRSTSRLSRSMAWRTRVSGPMMPPISSTMGPMKPLMALPRSRVTFSNTTSGAPPTSKLEPLALL